MKKKLNHNRGYSLVEVLVAITVLLIALVGPLTVAQVGLKRAFNSREQTMSVFLAQEGTEALFKLREDAALGAFPNEFGNLPLVWGAVSGLAGRCTEANPCGVKLELNGYLLPANFYNCSTSDCIIRYSAADRVPYRQGIPADTDTTNTKYERTIVIDVNNDRAIIKTTVKWGTRADQKITLETYLYNIYYEPPET